MCTAITHSHYFGRNLDLEFAYGEAVTVMPQNFPLPFRHIQDLSAHYAMIGMAHAKVEYPLYYDATNEYGLSMAGLRFREHCVYHAPKPGEINVASFELIPYVLGQCKTLEQAKKLLESCIITHESFSEELPPTPLHWIIADESGCITVESVAEGVRVYENPVGVLTNNPPFPMQLWHLNNYMNVTAKEPENRFASHLPLAPYSAGMGGMGLPGDFSSVSRFVKATFVKHNSLWGEKEWERVNQFFHILDSVAQIRGCVQVGEKDYEITQYSSCCNTKTGMYYYTTYHDRQIRGIGLFDVEYKGSSLLRLDMGL
ncbi:MAG: choloylglycine hydrolase, partial [Clostridia bacterium]|nr:choloylglycine hydrolase [Clostridia bacterium]